MDKLGDYTVLERLGKGGTGVVYRAHHDERGDVAIKLLPGVGRGARGRLLREASLVASLDHPRIIKVYGLGEHQRRPYIVMELLDGLTLTEVMRSGHDVSLELRLDLMNQVLDALVYAHEAGVVHCDVKPQNIFITRDGNVRMLDFGLAQAHESNAKEARGPWGTPKYMAPEQARGEEVDGRADIFSVGIVFYELLTGARAFGGGGMRTVLDRIVHHNPLPVHEVDDRMPEELAAIVRTAMAKDAEERYQTMRELLEAVEGFEASLAARRDNIARRITELLAPLEPIPPGDPGPPALRLSTEFPTEYLDLLDLKDHLESRRTAIHTLAAELKWVAETLAVPLEQLDDEALRGVADRADDIRESWPSEPRSEIGRAHV